MEKIEIYTDGGSLGNPGPGGYGVVIKGDDNKELSAGYRFTTNNRMEILAAIEALRNMPDNKDQKIIIHSDSRLLCDAVNKNWLLSWQRKNWKKSDKKPVLNIDLWEDLIEEMSRRNVDFKWVKGHAGIPENERCDELSKNAAANPSLVDEEYEKINKPDDKIKIAKKIEGKADFSMNANSSDYLIKTVERDGKKYAVISQTKNSKTGKIVFRHEDLKEFRNILNDYIINNK